MVDMLSNPTKPNHIYLIYMYKEYLALNNLQWLICHQTQPNQTRPSTHTQDVCKNKHAFIILKNTYVKHIGFKIFFFNF